MSMLSVHHSGNDSLKKDMHITKRIASLRFFDEKQIGDQYL